MTKSYVLLLISVLFFSCEYFIFKKDKPNDVVARVNSNYLYKNDLHHVIGENYTKEDSVVMVQNYIKSWISHQLLLDKAQLNLDNKAEEFEDLIQKYKEDLYINSYKEAVVTEYLDTVITQDDIDLFYNENKKNFVLSEELAQLKYVKLDKEMLNKDRTIALFKSNKDEDLKKLEKIRLNLKAEHLNVNMWVSYSDLLSKIPIYKDVSKETLLKKGSFIQKEDSISLYLLTVKQVLNRNEIAPKSYVLPTIKKMIIHKRKLALLRSIEETLIDDASKKEQFEIY